MAAMCVTAAGRPDSIMQSGSNLPITVGREAMRMPWVSGAELAEAIPPAYSEYIARQFLRVRSERIEGVENVG